MGKKEELIKLALANGIKVDWYTENMYDEMPNERNVPKDSYDVSDCMLVRTTDVFPKDKIIQTPDHGNAYGFGRSSIFHETLLSMIKSKYPEVMTDEQTALFFEELSQYDVFFEVRRSTTHYTINGLVSSHMYGNFEGKPYIILDPLEEHIDDDALIGLRVEDTYFNDDVELSPKSTIMMPVESFKNAINNPDYLETLRNFNVVVFEGDEAKAVDCLLHNLGYNAFLINNHGYVEGYVPGTEENKMLLNISSLAKSKGIPQDRHCYSEVYKKDYVRMATGVEESDKRHFLYVLDHAGIPKHLDEKLRYEIDFYSNVALMQNSVTELVNMIGLDQLRTITEQYNKQCVDEVQTKISEGHKRL